MSTNTTAPARVAPTKVKWAVPERYKVFLQQGMVLLVVVLGRDAQGRGPAHAPVHGLD